MSMYQKLAPAYDRLFPVETETIDFLVHSYSPGIRLLDIGSGTGAVAHAMGEKGFTVLGLEPDAEMLSVANNRHRIPGIVTFGPQGVFEIDEKEEFEGAYCIGNVLPHLSSRTEVLDTLKRIRAAVKTFGGLVVQIVNYDRILAQRITSLPSLEAEGAVLEREYKLLSRKIRFITRLKENGVETARGSLDLLPLRAKELKRMVERAGFTDVELFDGFSNRPFDPQSSFALVVRGYIR